MKKKNATVHRARSPNDIDKAVDVRLRKLRVEAGMTLQDLAAQIGISFQQVQKIEIGVNRISAGMLPIVADALGVELMEFFEDRDTPAAPEKTKADRLRDDCELLLRRVKSEEKLTSIRRVLKALVA